MFDKQYRFRGRHAYYTKMLVSAFDSVSKAQLFNRNVDIYINAPLIGFLYHRMAKLDNMKDSDTDQVYNQNVMGDRVIYSKDELMFNFQLIMLLDEEYEPNVKKRIDKAFRTNGKAQEDEDRFDSYVRGGIEVLYEKLIEGAKEPQDYIDRLYDFIEDFQERFNSEFTNEDILKLCTK